MIEIGPSKRARILVVEDEPLIAMMFQDLLEKLGCECVGPIPDRTAGLQSARTEKIDAAILNLILGGEKAYDIAEALAVRNIPFGFASGVHRAGIPERWLNRPYLEKPFTFADISRLVSELFAEASEAILTRPISTRQPLSLQEDSGLSGGRNESPSYPVSSNTDRLSQ